MAEQKNKSSGSKSKTGASSSGLGRADHVVVRNLFALAILRRQIVMAIIALIAAVLSIFSAYQVMKVKTPPQYIQLTEDGRIFPVAPLNVASAGQGEILNFASDSVKWVNTYDYISWRDQLQSQATRFTPQGWENFINSLMGTGNLATVQKEKLVVSARQTGQAYIQKEGVAEGLNTYVWFVRVPIEVKFSKAGADGTANSQIPPQKGTVSLYVTRVPLEINLRGYAVQIYQFELGEDKMGKTGI